EPDLSALVLRQLDQTTMKLFQRAPSFTRRSAPSREQNCFGTEAPVVSRVRLLNRVPLPAASTMAQD
ncbi:hypothetical protein ACXYUI_32915, partial [Klebsiella pneumoniae]